MVMMKNYTIFCTEQQMRKALELGAPIATKRIICRIEVDIPNKLIIPTAEQMIGWLEEQINFIGVIRQENNTWLYIIYPENNSNKNITIKGFSSRKEATLAAIDTALGYLARRI